MKALIDTCIVIDVFQHRVPFYEEAQNIFYAAANGLIDGYVTAKSVADIYYLCHKYTHDDKATRKILFSLLFLFSVIDTTAEDCRIALFSGVSDFEDALMIQSANSYGLDCIVTRNLDDYKKSNLPVYSPTEFLKQI